MTELKSILHRCQELHVVLFPGEDGKLNVKAPQPLPDDLLEALKKHKPAILTLLRPRPKEWHAQEIAKAVRMEGVCLFWSDLFSEIVAYAKDDTSKKTVPAGVVVYTVQELLQLFGEDKELEPQTLLLVHEAKRHGGCITDVITASEAGVQRAKDNR
jgi:hypothetical protein